MTGYDDIEFPLAKPPAMRGRRVVYKPNHRSFGAFIRSEGMRDTTAEVAEDIALMAAANTAPRSAKKKERKTGLHARVRKGFKVQRNAGTLRIGGNNRVMVRVVNRIGGSAIIEFGGRGMPRQRMLGRAGAAFGDFKPDGGPSA